MAAALEVALCAPKQLHRLALPLSRRVRRAELHQLALPLSRRVRRAEVEQKRRSKSVSNLNRGSSGSVS